MTSPQNVPVLLLLQETSSKSWWEVVREIDPELAFPFVPRLCTILGARSAAKLSQVASFIMAATGLLKLAVLFDGRFNCIMLDYHSNRAIMLQDPKDRP